MSAHRPPVDMATLVARVGALVDAATWSPLAHDDEPRIAEAYRGVSPTSPHTFVTVAVGHEGPPDGMAMLDDVGAFVRLMPEQARRALNLARRDTVCTCVHWHEEHGNGADGGACSSCDCASFTFSRDLNTAEAIADRGSDRHQDDCVCTLCRERPGWSQVTRG